MCIRQAACAHCGHGSADLLRFRNSTSGRVVHLVCRECFSQWIEPEPFDPPLLYPPDSDCTAGSRDERVAKSREPGLQIIELMP